MKAFLFFAFFILALTSFSQTPVDKLKHAKQLRDEEKYAQALQEVNQLIAKDSKNSDFYDFRAEIYYKLRKHNESIDDYTKAISLSPNDPIYYHHRAILFYAVQEPDLAIEDNNMALKFITNNDTLKYGIIANRGNAWQMKREFGKAYDDYMQAYAFDSTDVAILTNLGSVLDELGKADEAIRILKKVILLYPDEVGGYGNLAFQYMQMGRYKEALELNNKVLQINPKDPLGYNNRGFVKYKLNDLKGAMEDVNHSLQIYPANSYAYKNRALIYIALKQNAKACEDLKKAVDYGFTEMYGEEVSQLQTKYCAK